MISAACANSARIAFDFIQVRIASPEEIRGPKDPKERERLEMQGAAQLVVVGRGHQARDDQLPLVQAGEGRLVLRAHLRSRQGLGMPLRQVQAHPLSRRDLRPLRRRSDPVARCAASAWGTSSSPFPSRTSGSSRRCRARWATCSTSRCVISRRSSTTRTTSSSSRATQEVANNQLLDEDEYLDAHARRRRKRATPRSSPTSARPRCASCSAASTSTSSPTTLRAAVVDGDVAASQEDAAQAAQDRRRVPQLGRLGRHAQQAGVDDPGRHSGDSAGSASARSARRRPFRDVRSERSLSPRHQPQQPPAEAHHASRAGSHSPQREAHAAGSGRRAVRQRSSLQGDSRPRQASAQVAVRHAQGQAGPVPSEPARQARGLLGPFGHRRRSRAPAAPVRPAQADGARAVQAVHHPQARREGNRRDGEARQEDRGARVARRCTRSSKRSSATTRCS